VDPATRIIQRVAGKAYALAGTDEDMLKVLRTLAPTDFLTGHWTAVPQEFEVKPPSEELPTISGAVHVSQLQDPVTHGQVFEPVFRTIEENLPIQMRLEEWGVPREEKLAFPDAILQITTYVLEHPDGVLETI
ncbi:hypothetical protein ACTXKY_08500, partial [Corynebacterium variabile]|uniref:hypothetical protein n=2 Tax=Corynebacterium variabile TaxID=1727 RepID=UPI003FD0E82E